MKISPLRMPSIIDELADMPRNFLLGLLTGLLVPVAAVAGIVTGIYVFTNKIPFVTEIHEGDDDERHLTVKLVEPEEARRLFQRGREAVQAFGDEIRIELEAEE